MFEAIEKHVAELVRLTTQLQADRTSGKTETNAETDAEATTEHANSSASVESHRSIVCEAVHRHVVSALALDLM